MRILFVNNLYGAWSRGGAERVIEREVSALIAHGHEVSVVSSAPEGGNVSTANGIVVREAKAWNLCAYAELGLHGRAYRFAWHVIDMVGPGAVREILRIAKATSVDAVHTHNLMGIGFMLSRAVRAAGIRHVHTVHDVQLLHPSGLLPSSYQGPRSIAERASIALMRFVMGSPDVVIYPSEALKRLHDRHGFFPASDARVVRNPAPVHEDHARTRPEPLIFAFVGQLEPHKGVMTLLAAWQQWRDRKDAILAVIGSGSLEDEVRSHASKTEGVRVAGRLDPSDVRKILSQAAYAVVPSSVIENAPAVIPEAFAEGTPVIASATGGISELVIEGRTGFLCEPGSEESLLDALRRAARTASWDQMSEGAHAAARLLSVDAHANALEDAYR